MNRPVTNKDSVILSGVWREPGSPASTGVPSELVRWGGSLLAGVGTRQTQSKNPDISHRAPAAPTFLPPRLALLALLLGLTLPLTLAQQPAPPAPAQTPTANPPDATPPPGKVLFSRDANTPPDSQPAAPQQPIPQKPTASDDSLAVTDAQRSALTFTAYDLDVHLTPASAGISVRAGLTLRNDGAAPLTRLLLDITSSLRWDAFSSRGSGPAAPLPFVTHRVATDADHTGQMEEAVVSLPQPLAPGASFTLTALYSGAIPPSAERLERIGAPADQAESEDWDAIAAGNPGTLETGTALRGFGNVLWVPVAEPPVFLGDGAKLFQAVGEAKLRQSAATIRLRLAVEYVGDPPDAAFFCGRREPLIAISDDPNLPAAEAPGIATAIFDPQPLGFRTPSLFIAASPANNTGTPANPGLIAAITDRYDALPAYSAAAALVEPLLTDWLGPRPLTALTILDHPGQPFEDDALLVRPIQAGDPATLAPALAHSLTHAWIHSTHPWIDEGLAQFVSLLWTERTSGRAAALAALQDAARSLALIEPESPPDVTAAAATGASPAAPDAARPAGASLAAATGDVFYRTKAAAVWWMLRGIVGDEALKQTLQAYRSDTRLDRDPAGLQHTLEQVSHKDLAWFFNDWVYRDRGLPDLSIANVTPSRLESRNGLPTGWLVAVEVRNDGYAAAEVPVTVRSDSASQTQRLRIPGRSSASTRIVFAGTPEQVEINDGGVPETETSIHTRQLVLPTH